MAKDSAIRVAAQRYAFKFLAAKYHDEYRELYCAYLANRGISYRASKPVVDERELSRSDSEQLGSK